MLYENEITIIFNIVDTETNKIVGSVLTPRILRIPKEIIDKDVDTFLETYEPLLKYIRESCSDYVTWKNAKIMYYNIQEDLFEDVVVRDVVEMPQSAETYAKDVIIKFGIKCLNRFNVIDSYDTYNFTEHIETIYNILDKKNMSRASVKLFILSNIQDTEHKEILDIAERILNG